MKHSIEKSFIENVELKAFSVNDALLIVILVALCRFIMR